MTKQKASDYRAQSEEELHAAYHDLSRELYALRCERRESGQVEKPHRIQHAKKEIARILTVINEKKRGS